MKRADHCSCAKPAGTFGESGWHWRPSAEYSEFRAQDVAVERCPAYDKAASFGPSGRNPKDAPRPHGGRR